MSTTLMHANVQRNRFVQHVMSSLFGLTSSAFSLPARPAAASSAAESASLEAQKVRDLASSYSKTDPGFAADLYAAAARHEGIYED
jgi:hypothetical protein